MPSIQALRIVTLVLIAAVSRPAFAQASPSSPCTLCGTKGILTCIACKSDGLMEITCDGCRGEGTVICEMCDLDARVLEASVSDLSPYEQKQLELLRELQRKNGKKEKSFDVTKEKPLKAGRVDCHSDACLGGTVNWDNGRRNTCRVCDGAGLSKCPECSNGRHACGRCLGKKKLAVTCPHCGGNKAVECVGCKTRNQKHCPLCKGSKALGCAHCNAESHTPIPCDVCIGTGSVSCHFCRGTARMTCDGCHSTGKVRYKIVDQAGGESEGGIETCRTCDGKGRRDCECKKGRLPCDSCGGSKRKVNPCSKSTPCICVLDYKGAGWEFAGDLALALKNPVMAYDFLRRALDLTPGVGNPDPKIDAANKKRINRIESKIKAAQ